MELKNYKTVKDYIREIQKQKLEMIIELVKEEGYLLDVTKLIERTKKQDICQARRLIAYLARWKYNIDGAVIAKRLNLAESQVYAIIYSTFHNAQVEPDYRAEIEKLKEKLQCK